jgi:hypothetical protein
MPTIQELEEQARFEVEAFEEGTKRYREAIKSQDLTELTAGQRLLREVVGSPDRPGFAAAIAKERAACTESLTRLGQTSPWALPFQLIEEDDRLAVITLGAVLSGRRLQLDEDLYRLSSLSTPITHMARHISSAIRMQVEYDRWSEGNEALNKKLRKRFPTLHRNVWSRWRTKLNALREEPWDVKTEVAVGAAFIHLLVETAPKRFTIEKHSVRGKPALYLTISDETVELLDDVTTRMEVARPLLMPMICEPLDWRYEE